MTDLQWWWLVLGALAAVTVVVAILLGLVIATARRIEHHAAGIWTVGKQIAGNTVSIWMLDRTNTLLGDLRGDLARIEPHLGGQAEPSPGRRS